MSHPEEKPQSMTKYWPIMVFILGLAVTWGVTQNRQANAEKRIDDVEKKQTAIDASQTQILVKLGNIETNLEWVKASISGNKARVSTQ